MFRGHGQGKRMSATTITQILNVMMVCGGPAEPPQAHCILVHEALRRLYDRIVHDNSHGGQLWTKKITGLDYFVRVSWHLN